MNSSDYGQQKFTLTGKTLDEIRERLWNMHRDNYRIIDHQTILEGGVFGLFQKSRVKVDYVLRERQKTVSDDFTSTKEKLLENGGIDMSKIQVKQNSEIYNMLNQINSKISEMQDSTSSNVHPSITRIEKLLDKNEFTHSYISQISNRIRNEFPLEQLDDYGFLKAKVVEWIAQSIKIEPEIYRSLPHIIVLVGPTGRGKTTTISKLAAKPIVEAKMKGEAIPNVRLITIDRTRVGAEEQLNRFGQLMGVRVDKAESAKDLNLIINECKDTADYIFIDTSGYGPNDYEKIAKMRGILNVPGAALDTYLVLEASSKASDLIKAIESFGIFNFNSVIISKCDETSSYGNVLSVLHETNKSISYITTGQNVPKDIKRPSVKDFLFKLIDFDIDKNHIEDMFPEDN